MRNQFIDPEEKIRELEGRIFVLQEELLREKSRTGLKFFLWNHADFKIAVHARNISEARDLALAEVGDTGADTVLQECRTVILRDQPSEFRGNAALIAIIGTAAIRDKQEDIALLDSQLRALECQLKAQGATA